MAKMLHARGLAPTAGAGLIGRRALLAAFGAAASAGGASATTIRQDAPAWLTAPGDPLSAYGGRSPLVKVQRILPPDPTGTGSSRTPLQLLEGTITPSDLHFERHHSGIPEIDPDRHEVVIHGLVRRPLAFSMEALARYPMQTRLRFLECSGNSSVLSRGAAPQVSSGSLNGLLSASEWTGVPLSILLDEAGVDPAARWVIAEGADAGLHSRSVPLSVCLDDAILALYQNGEPLRPAQGYPVRLFLPGLEGNMSVKWLRRLKLTAEPAWSRQETSRYTELLRDGRAQAFSFLMQPKSVILKPSFGLSMAGPGLYEISGLAWAGAGKVAKVEVSADRGASWTEAVLGEPVLSKALARFRLLWRWDGAPAVLMSRATDERGVTQPTHEEWLAPFAPGLGGYHYNAVQALAVDAAGKVSNVHA